MEEKNKAFLGILKKIRFRLAVKKAIDNLLLVLSIALSCSIIAVIVSRFVPIYNFYAIVSLIMAAVCSLTIIFSIIKRPSLNSAALSIDSYGLMERIITAFELLKEEGSFAQLQKRDALEHLKSFNYKECIKLTPSLKNTSITLALIAVIAISAFIPNPMNEIALERHKLNQAKKEELQKVKKVEKELAENEKLTPLEKTELERKLSELKKDLKDAKNQKEINKAIEKTDKKLEIVKEKYDKEDLKKLTEALAKSDLTKNLSDLISKTNTKELKETIKIAAEEMKNLTEEQRKELAEKLLNLSKELKSNEELKEALAGLSQKLASGELGDISDELEQLAQNAQEVMNSDEFKEAVAQIQKELNQDGGGVLSAQGGNSPGNQSGGSRMQPGQQGGAGSGAGEGSSMGEENPSVTSPQSSGLNKKDSSEAKQGEYEKIFTSKNLGGQGETSKITGKKNNSGNSEKVNSEKGINVRGESVPYNQVIGSYKDSAMQSMESSFIPEGMKEIIKNYFTSLEE